MICELTLLFAQIDVKDYLWRYIREYHKSDLDDICGVDAKYTYDASKHALQIVSSKGKQVDKVRKSMEQLIQSLGRNIHDKECPMRQDVDVGTFRNIARSVVENENSQLVFYIDENGQTYHIIGPRDLVQIYDDEIQRQFLPSWHVDQVLHFNTTGAIIVEVFQKDLLLERVDAIVNPANVWLDHGGGAARAIAAAAGAELTRECRQFIQTNGELELTQVMHTTSGNLSPRILFVIHAAGPPADKFPDRKKLRDAMFRTFYHCLDYANNELRISSMSIPAIGAGIFGVPKRLVAETAYEALMAFDERIRKPGVKRYLREIHFVNIDADTTQVFIDTFNSLRATPVHRDDSTVTYTQTQRGRTAALPGPDSLMPGARRRVDESPEHVDTVIKVGVVRRGRRLTSEPRKPRRSSSIGDDNAQSADAADAAAAVAAGASDDDCVICLDTITDPKRLPCGHTFCADCIKTSFGKCQPKCPSCGKLFGVMNGNQPEGTMETKVVRQSLAGFERFDTIVIDYHIPSGIQNDRHPNPRQPYHGTHRTAYLPNNEEGKEVCRLLRQAFDAKLIFTVGWSVTDGWDNMVVWNDIHHKTNVRGPCGYPDDTYLSRVKAELAAKGIGV